jgi:hypothetical protein
MDKCLDFSTLWIPCWASLLAEPRGDGEVPDLAESNLAPWPLGRERRKAGE